MVSCWIRPARLPSNSPRVRRSPSAESNVCCSTAWPTSSRCRWLSKPTGSARWLGPATVAKASTPSLENEHHNSRPSEGPRAQIAPTQDFLLLTAGPRCKFRLWPANRPVGRMDVQQRVVGTPGRMHLRGAHLVFHRLRVLGELALRVVNLVELPQHLDEVRLALEQQLSGNGSNFL